MRALTQFSIATLLLTGGAWAQVPENPERLAERVQAAQASMRAETEFSVTLDDCALRLSYSVPDQGILSFEYPDSPATLTVTHNLWLGDLQTDPQLVWHGDEQVVEDADGNMRRSYHVSFRWQPDALARAAGDVERLHSAFDAAISFAHGSGSLSGNGTSSGSSGTDRVFTRPDHSMQVLVDDMLAGEFGAFIQRNASFAETRNTLGWGYVEVIMPVSFGDYSELSAPILVLPEEEIAPILNDLHAYRMATCPP